MSDTYARYMGPFPGPGISLYAAIMPGDDTSKPDWPFPPPTWPQAPFTKPSTTEETIRKSIVKFLKEKNRRTLEEWRNLMSPWVNVENLAKRNALVLTNKAGNDTTTK